MSARAREAERVGVLARVVAQTLTLREGAEVLGLSYRQAKRLLARFSGGRGAGAAPSECGAIVQSPPPGGRPRAGARAGADRV